MAGFNNVLCATMKKNIAQDVMLLSNASWGILHNASVMFLKSVMN
jgi:hypothetical protein